MTFTRLISAPPRCASGTPAATAPVTTITPCGIACSGIEGTVTESPTCPIGCAPHPIQATIVVWTADRTERVAEFTSDQQGRFWVPLAPSDYVIDPQGGVGSAPPPPFAVTVPPD